MRTRRAQLLPALEIPWHRVVEPLSFGARCQPKVGAELSAAGEWPREDLARQDRCTGATHPLQSAQQFSLPLDGWILRIGDIALLLDNAKLALDQLKALVFAFRRSRSGAMSKRAWYPTAPSWLRPRHTWPPQCNPRRLFRASGPAGSGSGATGSSRIRLASPRRQKV